MENSYIVYIHTLQNKKIYIGYLDMNSNFVDGRTFDEVMNCGEYHNNKSCLYADIQKYGWENVRTETISGLTKEQAIEKKKELCVEYQSYLPDLGYNRYTDAGLKPPPKIDKTPKGKFAKKIIRMFLHSDFTLYQYVLKCLETYTDDEISEMLNTIQNEAGYVALSLTRRKFDSLHSEARYLLEVLDDPHCIKKQIA